VHRGVVLVGDFVEREADWKPEQTPARHEHAQLELGIAFLRDQRLDLAAAESVKTKGAGISFIAFIVDSVGRDHPSIMHLAYAVKALMAPPPVSIRPRSQCQVRRNGASLDDLPPVHLERPVLDIADDLRFCLQFKEVVCGNRTINRPLTTTCDTLIAPSTRACSLTTKVPASPLAVVTLPCTTPSMRRPPVKLTSPLTVVPAPIRQSMRFCGGACFFRSNMVSP
jgi:hypothetical protein